MIIDALTFYSNLPCAKILNEKLIICQKPSKCAEKLSVVVRKLFFSSFVWTFVSFGAGVVGGTLAKTLAHEKSENHASCCTKNRCTYNGPI